MCIRGVHPVAGGGFKVPSVEKLSKTHAYSLSVYQDQPQYLSSISCFEVPFLLWGGEQ